jgi:hypothetical protein
MTNMQKGINKMKTYNNIIALIMMLFAGCSIIISHGVTLTTLYYVGLAIFNQGLSHE